MEKLEPLGDKVIVKPIEKDEVTKSGIILPDTTKEKPQEGEIIAAGPGRVAKTGTKIAMEVKVGDKVIFAKYSGSEIKIDGQKYLIMSESDLLAIASDSGKAKTKSKK
jgi:chaperonin GroES